MKAKRALIVLVVIGLAASLTAWFAFHKSNGAAQSIRVSGNIEVTDAQLSFKIPGRVEERFFDEGQFVDKGACVARLETADLKAELAMRQADLLATQSSLADLQAGSRPAEIQAAQARMAAGQADRDRLESDFRAGQKLVEGKVISEEEFAHRKGLFDAAAARVREAAEELALVQEGPRKELIRQAQARVEQAKAAAELAQTRLGYAQLASPLSGVVLSKNVEPGEYVAPGTPVITVGELERPWLRAYINETDLGRVKLNQTVAVTTDTFPGRKYEGTISFISAQAEFTPKSVQTQKERVKLVYRIKVDLPNPKRELKPGMPADGTIWLKESNDHAVN